MKCLYVLLLLIATALAHTSEAAYSKVFCEALLTPELLDSTDQLVRSQFFQANEFRADIDPRATDAAFTKLGLDGATMRRESHPLFLKLAVDKSNWTAPLEIQLHNKVRGQTIPLAQIPMPDYHPAVWGSLVVNLNPGEQINYQRLLDELPVTDYLAKPKGITLGIRSDVDVEGVRTFITSESPRVSSLGIDVPCAHVDKYFQGTLFHVFTRSAEFCRVPIVYFKLNVRPN